jgi:hypothetical protein
MLTNFFKTNPYVYEILKNNLEGELFKFQDFTIKCTNEDTRLRLVQG